MNLISNTCRSETIDTRSITAQAAGRLATLSLDGDASAFGALTFPRLRTALAARDPHRVAVGIADGLWPVGLALGELDEQGNARLVSLNVTVSRRRRGHGLALLEAWQREAARRGARSLMVSFLADVQARPAMEAVLRRAGWSRPEPLILRVLGRAGAMADIVGRWPAVRDRLSPPLGFQFTPVEPDAADGRAIARLLANPLIGTMRGPIAHAGRLVTEASVLIRRGSDVVGWIVAVPAPQKVQRDRLPAVEYEEFFLDPALWRSSLAVGAFHHCYRRQADAFGADSPACFQTHAGRPAMMALCQRRFVPIADQAETVLAARRSVERP